MSFIERKIRVAVLLMKRGSPLPLDLETTLIVNGIDVATLDATFRE